MNVFFLSGLPGVGKKTIAMKLKEKIGANVFNVSVDDYKVKNTDPEHVTNEIDPLRIRLIYCDEAISHAKNLLKTGECDHVIIHDTFHLRALRKKLTEKLINDNINVKWIHVTVTSGLVKYRLCTEGERGNHMLTNNQTYVLHNLFEKVFEPFADEENVLEVSNEENINLCTSDVLEQLQLPVA